MASWATSVKGAAAVLLFVQGQQHSCHHCPVSLFVASVPSPTLLYLTQFPSWLLWTLYSKSAREDVQSLLAASKAFWENHQALSRKQPSPPFRASAIYTVCWVDRGGDLTMLTLLLKWPPAGLPFTALWWNPVPPFIPTCAPQIFKLGLHKHCCAGEMIPNAAWSEPGAL